MSSLTPGHPPTLAESALLLIDVQDSFKADAHRWAGRNNPAFEANVEALVAAYRAANRPVIFFLHTDADSGFATDSPYFKLMDFLTPRANEPVLIKATRNAFTSTNAQPLLLERGVRRVAVCGMSTEQCCETTTRVAADLGFAVDFVLDATRSFPIHDPDHPGTQLEPDEIWERTVYVLRRRFARIVSTAQLVAELAPMRAERAA